VGDIIRVRAPNIPLGELGLVENVNGERSMACVIELNREVASLQLFAGAKGYSTGSTVRFLGTPMQVTYSPNILGRIFRGSGEPIDAGPDLWSEPKIDIAGPTVNPIMRVMPQTMIHTHIPMIDLFNSLVESQKIPIFTIPGEPHNELLARIGFQADADVVVFGGLGLIFDDFYFFRSTFEEQGVFHRTVMFVNLPWMP
jgi:V/A-type H+-transporting ATPase subunit B